MSDAASQGFKRWFDRCWNGYEVPDQTDYIFQRRFGSTMPSRHIPPRWWARVVKSLFFRGSRLKRLAAALCSLLFAVAAFATIKSAFFAAPTVVNISLPRAENQAEREEAEAPKGNTEEQSRDINDHRPSPDDPI